MRWIRFICLTLFLGLLQFHLRPFLAGWRVDIEWLYLIAFCSALHVQTNDILPVFWWCGFVQDLFLGARLGSNTILFSFGGLLVALMLPRFHEGRILPQATLLLLVILLVRAGRPLMQLHALAPLLQQTFWLQSGAACLAALLLAPLVHRLLLYRWLRPWKEEEAHYGLQAV